jgi:hypothetical protein
MINYCFIYFGNNQMKLEIYILELNGYTKYTAVPDSFLCFRVTVVGHLCTMKRMVATLRLALCHLVLQLVVSWDTLQPSPGSPVT